MDSRNTKQREIIIETLKYNKNHPTILELYQMVSEKDPTIGQATVYRNINRLLEEGNIKKIPMKNHIDRYDANCSPHYHFLCSKCHRFQDIFDEHHLEKIQEIEKEHQLKITDSNIFFEGICDKCL